MSLIAIILVLVSAFVHAGWNMMVKSPQASSAFLKMGRNAGAGRTIGAKTGISNRANCAKMPIMY
ncbi:MAG: hypothetical protein V7731_15070 [Amphritea sp.]